MFSDNGMFVEHKYFNHNSFSSSDRVLGHGQPSIIFAKQVNECYLWSEFSLSKSKFMEPDCAAVWFQWKGLLIWSYNGLTILASNLDWKETFINV